jgi:HAD superfamily hydrolase (TIGR01509 family)
MIHAVIFDFGNVISSFDVRQFLRNIQPFSQYSFEELQRLLPSLKGPAIDYETGHISSDQFYETTVGICHLHITREQFIHAHADMFAPIPKTSELIRLLKPRYKLGLLSNTNEWHYENAIKKIDVFQLFDAVTLSFQVRAMKPARAMYLDALKKLDLEAGTCVYIDDIQENVDAATGLGMHGIHYTSHMQLLADLDLLGIVTSRSVG